MKNLLHVFGVVCVAMSLTGCGSATRTVNDIDPNETPPPDTTTDAEPADMANGTDGNPIGGGNPEDAVSTDPLNP